MIKYVEISKFTRMRSDVIFWRYNGQWSLKDVHWPQPQTHALFQLKCSFWTIPSTYNTLSSAISSKKLINWNLFQLHRRSNIVWKIQMRITWKVSARKVLKARTDLARRFRICRKPRPHRRKECKIHFLNTTKSFQFQPRIFKLKFVHWRLRQVITFWPNLTTYTTCITTTRRDSSRWI